MTELNGIDCLRLAHASVPALKAVVFSEADDPIGIAAAFRSGASAYVLKTSYPEDLMVAVRQTFDPSLFFANSTRIAEEPSPPVETSRLTSRECETLALVAEGRSNKEIARAFWVTEQTVKFHLSNVYRKLGVSNRTEAAHWYHLNDVRTSVG